MHHKLWLVVHIYHMTRGCAPDRVPQDCLQQVSIECLYYETVLSRCPLTFFLVGFLVAFAEYFLMEARDEYSGYMRVVREKTFMSNLVISFLIENESASYEDLLQRLEVSRQLCLFISTQQMSLNSKLVIACGFLFGIQRIEKDLPMAG